MQLNMLKNVKATTFRKRDSYEASINVATRFSVIVAFTAVHQIFTVPQT